MAGSEPALRLWAPLLPIWAAYLLLARHLWFLVDDAYISFRYAKHLAEGMGLRFNPAPAPPVEGFSNLLWVLWCAVIEKLGGDPGVWAPLTAAAAGLALLAAVYRFLAREPGEGLWMPWLFTLSLALSPPFALWTSGGLETVPFALLFFLAFTTVVAWRRPPRWTTASALGVALVLIRAEGVLWAALIGVAGWWRARFVDHRRAPRFLVRYGIAVALSTLVLCVFRVLYFGDIVPNTVRAKAGLDVALAWRGLGYVASFMLVFLAPIAWLAAIASSFKREWRHRTGMLALHLVAVLGFVVVAGGDWMPMGRLLVPGLPFATALLGLLAGTWWSRSGVPGRSWLLFGTLSIIVLGLLPGFGIELISPRGGVAWRSAAEGRRPSELEMVRRMSGDGLERLGRGLRECSGADDSIVLGAIGFVGYYSGLHVHDRNGLVDREVAARPVEALRGPGHDKMVAVEHFLPRGPTYLAASLVDAGHLDAEIERVQTRLARIGGAQGRYAVALCAPPSTAPEALLLIEALDEGVTPAQADALLQRTADRFRRAHPGLADGAVEEATPGSSRR